MPPQPGVNSFPIWGVNCVCFTYIEVPDRFRSRLLAGSLKLKEPLHGEALEIRTADKRPAFQAPRR
jgi:hypothetical protein